MTSNCSDPWLLPRLSFFPAIIFAIAWLSQTPPFMMGVIGVILAFETYRDYRRRSTLRKREDGVYVWIEWHGGESSAPTDPTDDWDSEGNGDGDGGD